MATIAHPRKAALLESKSKIAELQRKIDELIRQYYATGDQDIMVRAANLARQKEQLLKPATMRSGEFKKVG